MRFVKPLDEALLEQLALRKFLLVTVEENAIKGGAGSAVNEWAAQRNFKIGILNLGLPDTFLEHGKPQEMRHNCGLDSEGILASIKERMVL
jgi:1-deoxy-D-xylulose-5-phosphate synthase